MPFVEPPEPGDEGWREAFEEMKRASEKPKRRGTPEARVFAALFMLLVLAGMSAMVVWVWMLALG